MAPTGAWPTWRGEAPLDRPGVLVASGACDSFGWPRRQLLGGSRLVPLDTGDGRREPKLALPLEPTSEIPSWPSRRPGADARRLPPDEPLRRAPPLELLRPHLPEVLSSAELEEAVHGARVAVAGLAVARQRPATASGVFMLIEDEHGQVNLIVPPPVYDRYRALVRGEPLLLARPLRADRPESQRPRRSSSRSRRSPAVLPTTPRCRSCPPPTTSALDSLPADADPLALAPGGARGRGRRRVFGADRADPRGRLRRRRRYTGLWTALRIAELEPDASIALVEADICGGGPSGRNGGFALSWWPKVETLIKQTGEKEAFGSSARRWPPWTSWGRSASAKGSTRTSGAVGGSGRRRRPPSSARGRVRSRPPPGGERPFEVLSAEEVQRRTGSPVHLGAYEAGAATVQPALLARGLRRVAVERSVRVFGRSPLVEPRPRAWDRPHGRRLGEAGAIVPRHRAWPAAIPG